MEGKCGRGARSRFRFRSLRKGDQRLTSQLLSPHRGYATRLRGMGHLKPHCITNNRTSDEQLSKLAHFGFYLLCALGPQRLR